MLWHFDSIHLISTNGSSRLQRPRAYFCLLHIHTHIHTKGPMWSWYSSHVPITHTYQWTILLCTEYHVLPTTHSHVTILIVVSPSDSHLFGHLPRRVQWRLIWYRCSANYGRISLLQSSHIHSYPFIPISIIYWLDLTARTDSKIAITRSWPTCFR